MKDYICKTIAVFDCLIHGKWVQKSITVQSNTDTYVSNDDLLDLICDYYPSVQKSGILFMVRIDNPDVWNSDAGAFIESIKCRALVDKEFSIGEIVIVNQELFSQYVENTVAKYNFSPRPNKCKYFSPIPGWHFVWPDNIDIKSETNSCQGCEYSIDPRLYDAGCTLTTKGDAEHGNPCSDSR